MEIVFLNRIDRLQWSRCELMDFLMDLKSSKKISPSLLDRGADLLEPLSDCVVLCMSGSLPRIVAQMCGLEISGVIEKKDPSFEVKLIPVHLRLGLSNFLCCSAEVAGRRVLVVDDITSSGVTLRESERLLKAMGAISVFGFVLFKIDNYDCPSRS